MKPSCNAAVLVVLMLALGGAWAPGWAIEFELPDLSSYEPAVASQLEELQRYLITTTEDTSSTDDELGEAYGELGRHYQAYGLTELAEACYRQAHTLTPSRFDWAYYLAQTLLDQGRFDEAETTFLAASKLNPDYLGLHIALARIYLEQDQLEEARLEANRASSIDKTSPAAVAIQGEVALADGRYNEAITSLQRALSEVPSANRLHYPLAMAYRAQGQPERARDHLAQRGPVGVKAHDPLLESLQELSRGEVVYLLRGRSAYRVGHYDEAVKAFRQAVEAAPDSSRSRVNLGTALAAVGDRQGAIEQFETALEVDSRNATANFNLGVLQAESGNLEAAADSLRRATKLRPDDASAHLELANLLLVIDRPKESLKHYETVTSLAPESEQARLGAAEAMIRLDRLEDALEALDQAHRALPTSGLIAQALARFLVENPDPNLRDGARALPIANRVYRAQATLVNARTITLAYLEIGDCDAAQIWYRRTIEFAEAASEPNLANEVQQWMDSFASRAPCHLTSDE